MKRMTYAALAVFAATAVGCSNGDNGGRMGSRATGGDRSQDYGRTEQARATLTGCLLAGGDAGSYVLQLASAADMTQPGTSGGSASAAADSASARTFRVVADKDEDIGKNLNKRVAISGYVQGGGNEAVGTSGSTSRSDSTAIGGSANENSQRGADSRASGSNGGGDMTSSAGSGMQTIRADSIRQVADSCNAQTSQQQGNGTSNR